VRLVGRPMFRLMILGLCAIATTGVVTATARPHPVAAATGTNLLTMEQRSLGLQGAANGRDAGGYRTTDGHVVRTGLVFRSNQLNNLTDADLTNLQNRGLRVIEDLRTGFERVLAPDRVPAGVSDRWRNVLGNFGANTIIDPASVYPAFITGPDANGAFSSVLHDIVHTDGAVLYHCSAGKDRTGWTSAVLLTILGVDRATVNQDYLLSNVYLHAQPGDQLTGVTLSELDSAFAAADRQYGNFHNYVRRGLGMTDADIAALKHKMLQ